MRLMLGVLDVAYSDASGGTQTTGDVAEGLENGFGGSDPGYHIMQHFFDSRQEKIAQWLADSMANAIEVLVKTGGGIDTSGRASSASHIVGGQKRTVQAEQGGTYTFEADQKIEAEFRSFLDSNEMSNLQAAVTGSALSAAAAAGVSHRKKHPYAKANKARPAFVDTGLYRASFRAWTEKG